MGVNSLPKTVTRQLKVIATASADIRTYGQFYIV